MMDWIPNRLVYRKRAACSPCASYANACLASMCGSFCIRNHLKFGGLL